MFLKIFVHSFFGHNASSASSVLKFSIPLPFDAEYFDDEVV